MSSSFCPRVLVVLLPVLALSGSVARAADPLLSGYGGPGDGEQVVLGSTIVPPADGNGSLRAPSSGGGRATGGSGSSSSAAVQGARATSPVASSAGGAADASSATPGTTPVAGTSSTRTAGTSGSRSGSVRRGRASAGSPSPSPSPAAGAVRTAGGALTVGPASPSGPATLSAGESSAGPLPLSRSQVLGVLAVLALLIVCAGATAALVRPATRTRSS